MNRYHYIEIFTRPLQEEKMVRRIDITSLSRAEREEKIRHLYSSDYPIESYQIVVTGSLKEKG